MERFRVTVMIDAELPDRHDDAVGQEHAILDRLWDAGARSTSFIQGRWHRHQARPRPRARALVPLAVRPRVAGPAGAGGARREGYRQCLWTASAHDRDPDRTARSLEDDLIEEVVAQGDGAVILIHGWPISTVATMDSLLQRLREAGTEIVTLDQLEPAQIPDQWDAADRPGLQAPARASAATAGPPGRFRRRLHSPLTDDPPPQRGAPR